MKKRTAWLVVAAMMGGASILQADPASVVRLSGAWVADQGTGLSNHADMSPDGTHVAFASLANNFEITDANGVSDVFLRDIEAETTVLVSSSSAGTIGNAASDNPSTARSGRFVAFSSVANNLVAGDTNGARDIFVKDLTTGVTTRVSEASDGTQANGASDRPAISADGNLVVFSSAATNLVEGDANGMSDIFVHNRKTGKTWRVSVNGGGEEGDGDSGYPCISSDGKWVAFESEATNLVAGDANGSNDVFLCSAKGKGMTRVSVSAAGAEANGSSYAPSLSTNGRYLAFDSEATNLVVGDTNGRFDVFLLDREEETLERVSLTDSDGQANHDSYNAEVAVNGVNPVVYFQSFASNLSAGDDLNGTWDVFRRNMFGTLPLSTDQHADTGNGGSTLVTASDDGIHCAFESTATNLVAADLNGVSDVFTRSSLAGNDMALASLKSAAADDGDGASSVPSISDSGRMVAFQSAATNLVPGDGNADDDIFVLDRLTGELQRASVDDDGIEANGASTNPRISGNGLYVAFESDATNFVSDDTNGCQDIFYKQLGNDAIYRVLGDGDVEANADCYAPVAGNNRQVAFHSGATNLVAGDTNGNTDVFYANVITEDIERVSVSSAEAQANGASAYAAMNPEGTVVAFTSTATNLVVGDTNGVTDVFVRDRVAGTTERVSVDSAGTEGDGHCWLPDLSDDGRYVAFMSNATNLVDGDTNGTTDIFVHNRTDDTTVRVSVSSAGTQGNGASNSPRISADGRQVTFLSAATNLVAGDTNGQVDVFVHDLDSGTTVLLSMDEGGNVATEASTAPDISEYGRHVVFANADGLVDQDENGLHDIFLAWNGIPALAPGKAFHLRESQVFGDPGAAFAAKPKVALAYTDPVKFTDKRKTAKVLTDFGGGGVPVGGGADCAWTGKVKLYNAKEWKSVFCRDRLEEGDLAADGELRVDATLGDGSEIADSPSGAKILSPPEIAWVMNVNTGNHETVAAPGQQWWVVGAFFGNKAPKVWLEYEDAKGKLKQAKCKVLANRYFADVAGNPGKSCMDPDSGLGWINVQLPAKWPKGWMPGRHDLVIDNGCGRACFRILTE